MGTYLVRLITIGAMNQHVVAMRRRPRFLETFVLSLQGHAGAESGEESAHRFADSQRARDTQRR